MSSGPMGVEHVPVAHREAWEGSDSQVIDGSEPLAKSSYEAIVRSSCGQSLVSRSLQVTIGPRNTRCDACRTQLFFVDRRGHALPYSVY
jgi:hypothetical protein